MLCLTMVILIIWFVFISIHKCIGISLPIASITKKMMTPFRITLMACSTWLWGIFYNLLPFLEMTDIGVYYFLPHMQYRSWHLCVYYFFNSVQAGCHSVWADHPMLPVPTDTLPDQHCGELPGATHCHVVLQFQNLQSCQRTHCKVRCVFASL
jgi:hypothetical protein